MVSYFSYFNFACFEVFNTILFLNPVHPILDGFLIAVIELSVFINKTISNGRWFSFMNLESILSGQIPTSATIVPASLRQNYTPQGFNLPRPFNQSTYHRRRTA